MRSWLIDGAVVWVPARARGTCPRRSGSLTNGLPRAEGFGLPKGGAATTKQIRAARRNVRQAQAGAKRKRSIAHMPARTRSALGKQGAAIANRNRRRASSPKTRQELYEEAKRCGLPGRSKMGRAELARALGHQ